MYVCVYICIHAVDREEVGDSGGDPSRPFAAVATREQNRRDDDDDDDGGGDGTRILGKRRTGRHTHTHTKLHRTGPGAERSPLNGTPPTGPISA